MFFICTTYHSITAAAVAAVVLLLRKLSKKKRRRKKKPRLLPEAVVSSVMMAMAVIIKEPTENTNCTLTNKNLARNKKSNKQQQLISYSTTIHLVVLGRERNEMKGNQCLVPSCP